MLATIHKYIRGEGLVFISYRSSDQPFGVEMIHERLIRRFGRRNVFLDHKALTPGTHYPDAIRKALEDAAVLVAVIGPAWLTPEDDTGRRLIDKEDDWVRRELTRAFQRGIPVLPVILDRASQPKGDELPEDIRKLATVQSLYFSRLQPGHDLKRLVKAIIEKRLIRGSKWRRPALVVAVAAPVIAVSLILLPRSCSPEQGITAPSTQDKHNSPVVPAPSTNDPRRMNPCSLATSAQAQLRQLGQAELQAHSGNFNRCDITFTPPNTSPVDVKFQLLVPGDFDSSAVISTKDIGSVKVQQEAFDNTDCEQDLWPPTSTSYYVNVSSQYVHGSDAGANLCRILDVAANADVPLLKTGGFGARTFDSTSLATVPACDLLTPSALARAGVASSSGEPGFGDWECRYGTGGLTVNLRFDQGQLDVSPISPLKQIGSHSGVVEPDGDDGGQNCLAQIQYRRIDGSTFEQVDVAVRGPQSSTALCGPAAVLAEEAAARLPVLTGH